MTRRLATVVGLFVLMGILSAGESAKFWVFFTDKNLCSRADTLAALEKAKSMLTPRCLARRAKVLPPDRIVDWRDIPIPQRYVDAVRDCGAEIVHQSRWFNAVSVRADSQTVAKIKKLPFVAKVRPVAVFREKISPEDFAYFVPAEGDAIYGLAKEQLRFMGIPPAHRMGIFGDGVLVCITDTGF
ncbi:MAG TPA: hypothetical protein ENG11_01895, partial [candidate division Zixibacteria bacterium]|nr:hypothetical protein [candidate division Zixibacteria bacterium]